MLTGTRTTPGVRTPGVTAVILPPVVSGPVSSARFAVIDVETSGLSPKRHRLLQLGVVEITGGGALQGQWDTLLRAPWRPLGGRSVHGLSRRALRGAPRFDTVVGDVVTRLDGRILCAHNIGFDWPFLVRALRRAGYRAPTALRLCTLELSRSLDPEHGRSHRLGDLCTRYGVALTRPHDAAADATATATLLPELLAEAQIRDLSELAPFLTGSTTVWPQRR